MFHNFRYDHLVRSPASILRDQIDEVDRTLDALLEDITRVSEDANRALTEATSLLSSLRSRRAELIAALETLEDGEDS